MICEPETNLVWRQISRRLTLHTQQEEVLKYQQLASLGIFFLLQLERIVWYAAEHEKKKASDLAALQDPRAVVGLGYILAAAH